jgi:cytochrome P450
MGGILEGELKMSNSKSILDQQTIQNPYPLFEELRRERPITYMPELKGYFVSSYVLAKKVLIDKRFGKTPTVKDGTKFVPAHPIAREILLRDEEIGLPIHCFSESDGPRFTAFRKMAEPFFTRISAPAMEREVQICADLLLDEIEKLDTCDLPSQYSSPFTTAIICKLVGVPRSMEREMRDYADASLAYRARVLSESDAVATAETLVRMHTVVRELLAERKANPKQDLMSVLTQATVEGAPLTLREQVYIVEEIVMGGSETTANAINAGLMYLGSHPELQDRIRKNPAQIPTFMEEVLRLRPPILSAHRHALVDLEIGGVTIKAGEKVYVGTASANRDEAQFKCPAHFDLERDDSKFHMAFGGGPHHCLGSGIARIEQRVSYQSWLKRFASFELMIPYESIRYGDIWVTRTPLEGPLRLTRA